MSSLKNKIINHYLLKRCFLDTISENGILGFQLGEDWNNVVYKLFFLKMIDYNQLCQLLNGTYPNDILLHPDKLKEHSINIKNKFIDSISFRNCVGHLSQIVIFFNKTNIFNNVYSILIGRFDFTKCKSRCNSDYDYLSVNLNNNMLVIIKKKNYFSIHLLHNNIAKT